MVTVEEVIEKVKQGKTLVERRYKCECGWEGSYWDLEWKSTSGFIEDLKPCCPKCGSFSLNWELVRYD